MTAPSQSPPPLSTAANAANAAASPRVAALVLAAGRSTRFGSDKRQARLPDGRTLLEAVLQTQRQACDGVLALLRPDDHWGRSLCADMGVSSLVVPDAGEGMGRTLASGLRALLALPDVEAVLPGDRFDAAMVVLADMPFVQVDTVRALIDAFRHRGRPACPWHAGRPGHPRLLPRDRWASLLDLSGDEGARHRLA